MEIEGAVAFVTGGSGGLGAVISRLLAKAGADVVVGYRSNRDEAERTATTIEALGRKAFLAQLDLSDPNSIQTAVAEATSANGQLDILINNAGVASGGLSIPEGIWRRLRMRAGISAWQKACLTTRLWIDHSKRD